MIITRTPYRVSFLGGGSDYPHYYRDNPGAVLGTTINKYCWIMVRKSPPLGVPYKVTYSKMEEVQAIGAIQHPAVREVLIDMGYPDPMEVHHTGDLPARSGMGSSSAFVVGLIKALVALDHDFWVNDPSHGGFDWTPDKIAEEAIYVERNLLHETVGDQDQYLCSYGGLNSIQFPSNQVTPVFKTNEDYKHCSHILERHLMLFYTGVERIASDVAATYVPNLPSHPSDMKRLVEMVQEGKEILQTLIHGGNPDDFGKLLHEAWNLKKRLSCNISTPEIDELYSKAIKSGAIGGKLLGAGGGGFLLLFAPPEKWHKIRKALALPEVNFQLENSGCQVVFNSEKIA